MTPPSAHAYGGVGPFEMGISWALALIATAVVLARFHVTVRVVNMAGWDLWWSIITYVRLQALAVNYLRLTARYLMFRRRVC